MKKISLAGFINALFLGLIALSMLLPFLNVIAVSFSGQVAINNNAVTFWPIDVTLENYRLVFGNKLLVRSIWVSIVVTGLGTLCNMTLTVLLAYAISRKEFLFKRSVTLFILFTFVFPAPMIPTYLLVQKLKMLETIWALIIPGAISTFNLLVLRSFFEQLPESVLESARMDGAGEWRTLYEIVLPMSKASLATVGLFYGVTNWNAYMPAMLYINRNTKLYPLQIKLRDMLLQSSVEGSSDQLIHLSAYGMKMTIIVVAAIPVLIAYPFVQGYFVKGVTLGSVKE